MLSVRPGLFLLPGAEFTPQIIYKNSAAILAVVIRLLRYNTCRRFLILRSNNFSLLMQMPGPIELAGSKSRGRFLLAGEFSNLLPCYWPRHCKDVILICICMKKWQIVTFLCRKVTNCYLFLLNSDKLLLFCTKSNKSSFIPVK